MGIRRMIGRTTLVVAALAIAVPLSACGPVVLAGPQETQTRDITGVSALDLRTAGDLTITVGDTESLTVTAGSGVITSLTSEVEGGTLVLDSDVGVVGPNRIRYSLTVRHLDRVRITGSGSVSGAGVFRRTGTVEVAGSGSASLTDNETAELTVTIDGSGDVAIDGASESLTLLMAGSGDFDGGDLRTRAATASVGGSGSARVLVTEDLDATVSGSGELVYDGEPAQLTTTVTGSGEISAR